MEYGRIVRVVRPSGAIDASVVAEPDNAMAVAIPVAGVAKKVGRVDAIGRASFDLLRSMGLKAGQFAKA